MFNVLVVDDEAMICTGVASALEQSDIGVNEVFVASNAFEALDYLRMERIDLLITDIQMDQMSGIELIETLFAENPLIPVVVLSAHGEFEYAQKALRFGVKEYIVKPVKPAELVRTARSLLTKRESQMKTQTEASFSRKFSLEEMTPGRSYILNELAAQGFGEEEADEVFSYLGRRMDGPYYCMLEVRLDWSRAGRAEDEIRSFRDRNLLKYASLNVIEESLAPWDCMAFHSGSRTISVLLQFTREEAEGSPPPLGEQTLAARLIHGNLLRFIRVRSAVGISRTGEGFRSWPELYKEAGDAVRWSEVHPDHDVFYIGDFGRTGGPPEAGEDANAGRILEDNNSFIRSAVKHLEENFRRKGLKLQEVADAVCLSPNYLSYLFKKIVGINLWDYVTKLRMEEARRLLLTTDMRRYEIADEVGYETAEHFGKVFKKHFGLNPSEIKNEGKPAARP